MKSRKVSGILISAILAAGLFILLFEVQESETIPSLKGIMIHVKNDSNKPAEATCMIFTDASGTEFLKTNKGGVAKASTVREATVATISCTTTDGKNGSVVYPLNDASTTSITVIVS